MNLEIIGKEPFATLNPLEVKAYLTETGWSEVRVLPGRGSFWSHAGYQQFELPLPFDRSVGDFADRMRDAVEILAQVEERSQVEILRDLERAGQDVIRVRLAAAEIEDGSVSLQQGVELLEAAKNAVYASAWAASSKRLQAYYHSRPPKPVTDFMDTVRLGQTERGSYVVTIEAPVSPELRGQDDQAPEPFGRRVTRTLATSLHTLLDVASRGNARDIEGAVPLGVSANLCRAVADALRLSGSQGELEVHLTWARTRKAPKATPRSVRFPRYLEGVLAEAASLLRSISEIEGFELEGTVYQLRQDSEALILGWIDERYRKVKVNVPVEYRELLIRAYKERSVLRCIGELRQAGKTTELLNARSFFIEETDESEAVLDRYQIT